MSLDKKSLIQIVILVILVAVGGGAYLMQQDDGLNLDFITELFESKPTVTRAPVAKAPAPVTKPSSTVVVPPVTKSRPDAPAIPSTPAKGQIQGKPFMVDASTIENGVLSLHQGRDVTSELEVRLMLGTSPWDVPAGKNFRISGGNATDAPQILLAWKEKDNVAPTEKKFSGNYSLLLELGQEKDGKLPGKIALTLPDEEKSNVAGTFEATIKGFRIVNGKPDLTVDSVDTLQYLALRELLKDDANKTLEVLGFRDGRYSQPDSSSKNMTGYIEAEYRKDQSAPSVRRFQFEKDAGTWKLVKTLKENQLNEAHPLQAPNKKDSPAKVLTHLAAKKLEADIRKKFPAKGIYEPIFVTRHSDKFKIGVCEANYRLEPAGVPVKTAYLFRRKAEGWALDRELGKKEKVNFDNGRIVKR
jgi:hypothetical protein